MRGFLCFPFFFFSSRRRHTRFDCDWSSDVCSSDLRQDDCIRPQIGNHLLEGLHLLDVRQPAEVRSEEHTSELQSQSNLVCRLLLEKKKKKTFDRALHHLIQSYVPALVPVRVVVV